MHLTITTSRCFCRNLDLIPSCCLLNACTPRICHATRDSVVRSSLYAFLMASPRVCPATLAKRFNKRGIHYEVQRDRKDLPMWRPPQNKRTAENYCFSFFIKRNRPTPCVSFFVLYLTEYMVRIRILESWPSQCIFRIQKSAQKTGKEERHNRYKHTCFYLLCLLFYTVF